MKSCLCTDGAIASIVSSAISRVVSSAVSSAIRIVVSSAIASSVRIAGSVECGLLLVL